jgi:uncharacterized protein YecT (DUF1311 family)
MGGFGNRLGAAIVLAFALQISTAFAALSGGCQGPWFAPLDFIVCNDREIAALNAENADLYRRSLANSELPARRILQTEQRAWQQGIANRCQLPTIVEATDALRARPCVVDQYLARIEKLAKTSGSSREMLRSRPLQLAPAYSYFTIVTTRETPADAIIEWERLRKDFPFESFDLYPPYASSTSWMVVSASYVNEAQAHRAREAARALAISPSPAVWRIPEPGASAPAWTACQPSPFAIGKMTCGNQEIDIRAKDIASANDYLRDRLNDRPADINTGTSFFTVVASLGSKPEAQRQLNRLMRQFPAQQFSLYPPYLDKTQWMIVVASYTDDAHASQTLALAQWLGISQDAYLWQIPQPFDVPKTWVPEDIQHVVLSCLAHGATSILEMFNCSGSVLTPPLLRTCIQDGVCELNMTPIAAAQYLASQNLSWNAPLVVQAKLPDLDQVKACQADHVGDEKAYIDCALKTAVGSDPVSACPSKKNDAKALAICVMQAAGQDADRLDCLISNRRGDPTACLDESSAQNWVKAKDCLARYSQPFDAISSCISPGIDPAITQVGACLTKEPTNGLKCASLLPGAADTVELVSCLGKASTGPAALLGCAGAANLKLDTALNECLQKATTDAQQWITSCLPNPPTAQLSCFTRFSGHNDDVLTCLASADSRTRDALAAIRCVSSGKEPSDLLASCTEGFVKDPKARQALACAAKSNGDMGTLAGCAAAPFLGGDQGRLLTCAAQSQSYAGFALCAAGPKMNPEWMVAAQCAASSGGVPVTAAACTAGWLTLNELSKCFSKGIGGSGCFGPDNTIAKAINNAVNDLTKGPGPNNEVVKALKSVGIEVRDVSFRTPLGGHDAFLPKAGRDFDEAKNKAGKWFAKTFGW